MSSFSYTGYQDGSYNTEYFNTIDWFWIDDFNVCHLELTNCSSVLSVINNYIISQAVFAVKTVLLQISQLNKLRSKTRTNPFGKLS